MSFKIAIFWYKYKNKSNNYHLLPYMLEKDKFMFKTLLFVFK